VARVSRRPACCPRPWCRLRPQLLPCGTIFGEVQPFSRPGECYASPAEVLRRLGRHTRSRGLPPPAALTGDWFGGGAVIAPSVEITATAPHRALSQLDVGAGTGAPGPVGGGWIGFLGYELTGPAAAARRGRMPAAAWGWTDRVLRQDPTGRWWLESLYPISP